MDAAAPSQLPERGRRAAPATPRSANVAAASPRALDARARPGPAVVRAAVREAAGVPLGTARTARGTALPRHRDDPRPRAAALARALPAAPARARRSCVAIRPCASRGRDHRCLGSDEARRHRAPARPRIARQGDPRGRRRVVRAAGARRRTHARTRALQRHAAVRPVRGAVRSAQEHGRARVGVRARCRAPSRSAARHRGRSRQARAVPLRRARPRPRASRARCPDRACFRCRPRGPLRGRGVPPPRGASRGLRAHTARIARRGHAGRRAARRRRRRGRGRGGDPRRRSPRSPCRGPPALFGERRAAGPPALARSRTRVALLVGQRRQQAIIVTVFSGVLFFTLGLVAWAATERFYTENLAPALTIDGRVFPMRDYKREVGYQYVRFYIDYGVPPGYENDPQIAQQKASYDATALDQLVEHNLLDTSAKADGFVVTSDQIQDRYVADFGEYHTRHVLITPRPLGDGADAKTGADNVAVAEARAVADQLHQSPNDQTLWNTLAQQYLADTGP